MSNTTAMRAAWAPACSLQAMTFRFWNGVGITIDARAAEAFSALDFWLEAYNYGPEQYHTGSYVCRKITGGSGYSLHSYGIAVDINWQRNPYSTRYITDMSREMVDHIEDIVTNDGVPVWRWGGDWDDDPTTPHDHYDTMHYELSVSPGQLAKGINQLISPVPDPARPDPFDWEGVGKLLQYAIMEEI